MRTQASLKSRTGIAVATLLISFPAALQAAGDHGKPYGHAGAPEEVDRTVRVRAEETRFSHEQIAVEQGQTVRFVVINTGETQHEFTIGPPKVQQAHRAEMREMMGAAHNSDEHHGGADLTGDGVHHRTRGGNHHASDSHHGDGDHQGDQAGSVEQGAGSPEHKHANSVMVQPGETKELIWHFAEVDNVRFGCNVPGHYQAGMHGPFVARE